MPQTYRPGDTVTYQGTEHVVEWTGLGATGRDRGLPVLEIRDPHHTGPAFTVHPRELDH